MPSASVVTWCRCIIAAPLLLASCERDKAVDGRFTTRAAAEPASTAISDSAINQAVLSRLREGPGIDASLIVATTEGGIVELTGQVDTLFAKDRAARLAQSVNGVRAVDDHVAVRFEQRPDKDLTTDVNRAILQIDLASSSSIAASAREGVVTLTGCVRSRQARAIAGRIAESVRGAREVRNQLILYDTPGRCAAPVTAGMFESAQAPAPK
jgi:osmotically-inducible protein OsmY